MANLAGRLFFNGRIMKAQTWDGKTKYRVEETEEEERARLEEWAKYLDEGDDDNPQEDGAKDRKKEKE